MKAIPGITNCLITTRRGSVPKLTNVEANRDLPQMVYAPDGTYVEDAYVVDGVPPGTALPGTSPLIIDVQEGDMLTESGRPAGVIKWLAAYPTGIVHTEIIVVRSVR